MVVSPAPPRPLSGKPAPNAGASAAKLWTTIDSRIHTVIDNYVKRNLGIARPRSMTLTVPLAGTVSPPITGWLVSVAIFQPVRISAWMIHALVAGQISIDLQVASTMSSPGTAPVLTSLINAPGAPTPVYLSLNGYTTASFDTSSWFQRDIFGNHTLHIIVHSASAILQASLGLQLTDLQGRTLQI